MVFTRGVWEINKNSCQETDRGNMKISKRIPLTFGIGTALLCGGTVGAQTPPVLEEIRLEEIVVTAERRDSDLQKTAISMDVRKGDDLVTQGKATFEQILEGISGVTVGEGGAWFPGGGDNAGAAIVIRGTPSPTGSSGNVPIATTAAYTDGIYSGVGSGYDIDRVEVLRGPQGTLYGRSATSGVVATHTRNPVLQQFEGYATAEFGNYKLIHDEAAINLPMGDQLAVRVAGNYYSRDGFVSAEGTHRKTVDGRMKVLYQPSDNFSLLVGVAIENSDFNLGGLQLTQTSPTTVQETSLPISTGNYYRHRQYWAELNWDLGFGKLTYLPAYRTFARDTNNQGALGPFFVNAVDLTPPSKDMGPERFVTHELRLASEPDSPLIWQVGAMYYGNDYQNNDFAQVVTADGTSLGYAFKDLLHKKTSNSGIFGEATWPFADTWRLTGGLRYDHSKVDSTETYTSTNLVAAILSPPPAPAYAETSRTLEPGAGVRTFNNITYKARLEKDLTTSNLMYVSVSTGFLPGDVQVIANASGVPEAKQYDVQKLTAYEFGSKNRFLDNRLQLNGSLYYNDYTGFQTSVRLTGSLSNVIVTSPMHMYGGEFDLVYQMTDNDRVGVSYAYTNSTFVDKPADFSSQVANDKVSGVAPSTATVNYDHTIHLGSSTLDLHADARYTSAFYSADYSPAEIAYTPYIHVDSQWVGDLSGTWALADGKYSFTGYIRNVTNNDYKTSGQLTEAAGGGYTATATQYEPRTYGVVLHVGF